MRNLAAGCDLGGRDRHVHKHAKWVGSSEALAVTTVPGRESQSDRVGAECCQQDADFVADLGGVAHGVLAVDGVVIASSDAGCLDVSGFDQVGEDALGCAFGDADAFGDVAEPDVVCLGEADEDLGVVGEEGPGLRLFRT